MTKTKRPLKVFLCHAHSDKDAVKALYTRLTKDGVDAWLDKEKLLPGQDWELEIRKAVREADVVVVCLSKQFNQAGFRQKEVRLALDTAMEKPEGEIFIIPARLEECDTLESLRKWHWVDLFEDDGFEMLMRALRARANSIGVTLQIKKGWLPNITAPRKSEAPVEKKPERKPPVPKADKPKPEKVESAKVKTPRKPNTAIIVALIGLVGTICAALVSSPLLATLFERTPEPTTIAAAPVDTKTPAPSKTPTRSITATSVFTPTATPFATEITDAKGVTMRLVPAGEFTMGSETYDDEKPIHQVYLDAFYMDIYEVTNTLYEACVDAGGCTLPKNTSRYDDVEYENHPVVYVDWNQADAYCSWRDASLPTEAQWEKAARGEDGRTYPWGEGISCNQANYYDGSKYCVGDTTEVGSYESGKSPYGMYDMAGNVWEWVNDWYDENYYSNSPFSNPLGPDSGQFRVLRGGAWDGYGYLLRASLRDWLAPGGFSSGFGFRCVRSLP